MSELLSADAGIADTSAETPSENLDTNTTDESVSEPLDTIEEASEEFPDENGILPSTQIKLKVNGASVTKTYSEVIADAQKFIAWGPTIEKAKQEVAEARKVQETHKKHEGTLKNIFKMVADGRFDALDDFAVNNLKSEKLENGLNKYQQGMVDYVTQLYKDSQMDPEMLEGKKAKRELDKWKANEEAKRQEADKAAYDDQFNKHTTMISETLPKAFAQVGLAQTKIATKHVLEIWMKDVQAGNVDRNPAEYVAYVKKQLEEDGLLPGTQVASTPAPKPRPKATTASVKGRSKAAAPDEFISASEYKRRNR